MYELAALLSQRCQREEGAARLQSRFLVEFTNGAFEQIARFHGAFRDRPGAFVAPRPIRSARMREQNLQAVPAAEGKNAGANLRTHTRSFSRNVKPGARAAGLYGQRHSGRLSILIVDRFAYLVFRASDGVLDLAFGVLSLAFGFELGIAGQLPASFLYLPFCLFQATFNAIFIHRGSFLAGLVMSFQTNGQARAFVPTLPRRAGESSTRKVAR